VVVLLICLAGAALRLAPKYPDDRPIPNRVAAVTQAAVTQMPATVSALAPAGTTTGAPGLTTDPTTVPASFARLGVKPPQAVDKLSTLGYVFDPAEPDGQIAGYATQSGNLDGAFGLAEVDTFYDQLVSVSVFVGESRDAPDYDRLGRGLSYLSGTLDLVAAAWAPARDWLAGDLAQALPAVEAGGTFSDELDIGSLAVTFMAAPANDKSGPYLSLDIEDNSMLPKVFGPAATATAATAGAAAGLGPPATDTARPAAAPPQTPAPTTAPPTAAPPTATSVPASPTAAPPVQPTQASTVEALGIAVTALTSPMARGAEASLTIHTLPGAACSIVVNYKSGPSKIAGLGPQTADANGTVTWSWKVGTRTPPGTWRIVLTASAGGQSVSQWIPFVVQ
jgi:hypothetical protein